MPKTGDTSTFICFMCASADTSQIDALYECCNSFYQKNGDDAKTVSCPKAGLLRLVVNPLITLLYISDSPFQTEDEATGSRNLIDLSNHAHRLFIVKPMYRFLQVVTPFFSNACSHFSPKEDRANL